MDGALSCSPYTILARVGMARCGRCEPTRDHSINLSQARAGKHGPIRRPAGSRGDVSFAWETNSEFHWRSTGRCRGSRRSPNSCDGIRLPAGGDWSPLICIGVETPHYGSGSGGCGSCVGLASNAQGSGNRAIVVRNHLCKRMGHQVCGVAQAAVP